MYYRTPKGCQNPCSFGILGGRGLSQGSLHGQGPLHDLLSHGTGAAGNTEAIINLAILDWWRHIDPGHREGKFGNQELCVAPSCVPYFKGRFKKVFAGIISCWAQLKSSTAHTYCHRFKSLNMVVPTAGQDGHFTHRLVMSLIFSKFSICDPFSSLCVYLLNFGVSNWSKCRENVCETT